MFYKLYLSIILCTVTLSNIQGGNTDDHRYSMIQTFLNQYERQFTMLDIGADQGYYSLRTAHDYNAVCVMIEVDNPLLDLQAGEQLLSICKKHCDLKNIILLKKLFTPADLKHLSECEDFDVVLALNFVHKFGQQWQEAIEAILHLADHVIIEIPSDRIDIEKYILAKGGYFLGAVADTGLNVYILKSSKKSLLRKTWLRLPMKKNMYTIESSFIHKNFSKPDSCSKNTLQVSPWLAGINLVTFKMCHGVYPTKETLQESLLSITDVSHTDWLINNMIIQGDNLIAIDGNDNLSRAFFSEKLLRAHQELLNLDHPEQVEHYFWKKLINVSLSRRQVIKFFAQLFPPSALLFNIGFCDEIFIDRCLGYGAKVIYLDLHEKRTDALHDKFKQDDFIITNNALLTQDLGDVATIDNMILQYGTPKFCIIDQPNGSTYRIIKTLSEQISCIAYNFDIRFPDDFIACLHHLSGLGYTEFNFSVRDIPSLILEPNKYTGTHKEWAYSADELLHEINEFSCLDHDSKALWGFIYAKK